MALMRGYAMARHRLALAIIIIIIIVISSSSNNSSSVIIVIIIIMPPALKKSWGQYCFWLVCSFVRPFVHSFVRHAFWCIA